MLYLSEILIQHHEIENFEQLCDVVSTEAKQHVHFKIDVKPPYPDTPPNWEDRLEGAFVGIYSVTR
jgi:hypothetical protein